MPLSRNKKFMARDTKNVTLSIYPDLHEYAISRAKELRLSGGFSALVTRLIQQDMEGRETDPAVILRRPPPHLPTPKKKRGDNSVSGHARKSA